MARKEFIRRLRKSDRVSLVGRSAHEQRGRAVREDDLLRLITEYEQISEALLMLEYNIRQGLTPHPDIPGVTKLPREVQLAVKLLRPKKRSKS